MDILNTKKLAAELLELINFNAKDVFFIKNGKIAVEGGLYFDDDDDVIINAGCHKVSWHEFKEIIKC